MTLGLDHPWLLAGAIFCLPPLLGVGTRWLGYGSLGTAPPDPASRAVDAVLRVLAAAPVLAIVLGLAGLHREAGSVTRSASGAHIIVVLDRSLSMGENFALRGEKAHETKTQAAARMIAAFFARNPHDRFGLVAFSTAPILAMPLTEHRAAIGAAIAAMRQGQLGDTDIGSGIALALALFEKDQPTAPHVILLVTDGAGDISERVRMYLRNETARVGAHLYYLYLRAGDDPPLGNGLGNDTDMMHPAALDGFFRSLDIPYQAFEARDAGAIDAATRRIETIERHSLTYTEVVPRRNLDHACFAAACVLLALSVLAQMAERTLPRMVTA